MRRKRQRIERSRKLESAPPHAQLKVVREYGEGMRDILAKMPQAEQKKNQSLAENMRNVYQFRPGAFTIYGSMADLWVSSDASVKVAGGTYDAGKTYGLCARI